MQCGAVDWIALSQDQLHWQVIVTETCSCCFKINIVLLDALLKVLLLNVPVTQRDILCQTDC
jgi:hypothetical protein